MVQGRLSPLEWWKPTPPQPPTPSPSDGDGPPIHALYLSQVGVLEREESYELIIEGAKHPRIEGGEGEK